MAVAAATGDRAAVFWTRPEDVDMVTNSADPGRFPFPALILTPGQARTLEQQLEGVTPGRLSTTADADFVQRMLGRDQDRTVVRIPVPFPGGTLALTLHRVGPPPLWSDPEEGGVVARVSGSEATRWVGTLAQPISRLSVAFEIDQVLDTAAAERIAREQLSSLVLTHIWRLVEALPDGPAAHRLLAEVTARMGLPHFVDEGAGVRLDLSFPAAGPAASSALWRRPLCTAQDGQSVSLAQLVSAQGTDTVIHLRDSSDLSQLEAIERKLGWGHLATPALSAERLLVAVLGPSGWNVGPEVPHDAHEEAIVWLGACLHTPIPSGNGWQAPVAVPRLPGIGFAVRASAPDGVDWSAGLTCLFEHLRRARMQDWKVLSVDSTRARARAEHALLQLAGHLGAATLLTLPWLRASDHQRTTLESVMQSPRRAAHPLEGVQIAEPDTYAVTLDHLKVIHAALGPDALPLRFDDPPTVWWNLNDPNSASWLVRRRIDMPGMHGWLGLRREFDETTGVFVRGRGTWSALQALDAGVPCHGLLWRDDGASSIDDASRELLTMTRHELYTDLVEKLQAGGWSGADRASAEAYAARFHRERTVPSQTASEVPQQGALDVADDDRLSPLRARLEPIFGRTAGGVFFGLTLSEDDSDAPMVELTADDERGIMGFFVDRHSPLVMRAMAGEAKARAELSAQCHDVLEKQFARVRTNVGHFPRVEALAFLLVGSSPGTPQLTAKAPAVRLACHLTLNAHQEVVDAAVRKAGPARELVLLECARQLHGYFQERGEMMDLHMVHRRLVASRLT
ncbi:MAG: hypothetical protein CL927_00195 [Deltaproteobacteria bacterium]|nr:hypothetical protein [Deltaproteobacteria bacterium]